jgi:hypothetical protein
LHNEWLRWTNSAGTRAPFLVCSEGVSTCARWGADTLQIHVAENEKPTDAVMVVMVVVMATTAARPVAPLPRLLTTAVGKTIRGYEISI